MKEAYYFSHDSNARNDEKIIALRMKYDWKGYGIFWALVEKLRDSTNFECSKDYNIIAFDLRVDASIIKSIVEDFGLFVFTDCSKYFYSERLKQSMDFKESKSKKATENANKRWNKCDGNATAMQTHKNGNAIKENIIKENIINNINNNIENFTKNDFVETSELKLEIPKIEPPESEPPLMEKSIAEQMAELRQRPIDECRKNYDKTKTEQIEAIAMKFCIKKINMDKFYLFQDEFDIHVKSTHSKKSFQEYAYHFSNWMNKKTLNDVHQKINDFIKYNQKQLN